MMGGGKRSAANWRFRIFKRYRQRVDKFLREADSFEERAAWNKVSDWINSVLNTNRFMTETGAIGLSSHNNAFTPRYLKDYLHRLKQEIEWVEDELEYTTEKEIADVV